MERLNYHLTHTPNKRHQLSILRANSRNQLCTMVVMNLCKMPKYEGKIEASRLSCIKLTGHNDDSAFIKKNTTSETSLRHNTSLSCQQLCNLHKVGRRYNVIWSWHHSNYIMLQSQQSEWVILVYLIKVRNLSAHISFQSTKYELIGWNTQHVIYWKIIHETTF